MSLVTKVIINADDFGRDENATKAILESFGRGFITQTTLMVNMPWAEKAVELARIKGFSDKIGLHLNLTEGHPLTNEMASCDIFCDHNGLFKGCIPTCKEVESLAVRRAVVAEIDAQIKRYKDFNLQLMHCDGHHHVQIRMHIAVLLLPLLAKHGFKSIRRPSNMWTKAGLHIRSRIHQLLFTRLVRKNNLQTTDWFSGWDRRFGPLDINGSLEIMVHPRYDADDSLIDVTDFRNCRGRKLHEISSLIRDI